MKKLCLLVILLGLLQAALQSQELYTLNLSISGGVGGIIVTPPGQIVRNNSFFIFQAGTAVTLEAVYEPAFTNYCQLTVGGHQWGGDWTGNPTDKTGTIVMNGDKSVNTSFMVIAPPCPAPVVTMNVTPRYTTLRTGKGFTTDIQFSVSSSQSITGYDLSLLYTPGVIALDASKGNQGIEGAPNVTMIAPGEVRINADSVSAGPQTFKAYWTTAGAGDSSVAFSGVIRTSVSGALQVPGSVAISPGLVKVSSLPGVGDANGDNVVDIVDALVVSRYAVGVLSALFNGVQADVNRDGTINIVDALQIAQFYVGLIELQGIR